MSGILFISEQSITWRTTLLPKNLNYKEYKIKILFHPVVFIVAPYMLIVLSPFFVQLMQTNYYKIVKQLKSFKVIIVVPTRFGLHKPSSGSSLPVLRCICSHNTDNFK